MTLMQERKDFNFPPFSRIVEITIKDTFEDRAERMAMRLGNIMRKHFEPAGAPVLGGPVTGPYAPVVDKIADQHIRTIRISLKKDRALRSHKSALREIITVFEKSEKYIGHIAIDVDPT
jgi:primosomal protein N' (replication factor Y)